MNVDALRERVTLLTPITSRRLNRATSSSAPFSTGNVDITTGSDMYPALSAVAQSTAVVNKSDKTSSLASSINLMKNCVGAGVLSLNGRVNLISPTMAKYPQVFALIFAIAIWAIHNFYIVGEAVRLTGKQSFLEAWSAAVEEGNTKPLVPRKFVTLVITCAPIVSCIANTIVLTDTLKMMLRVLGVSSAIYSNRSAVVAMLTVFVLLPLCTVESLGKLKSISLIGLSGHMLAVLVMLKRSLDGSYLPGGVFHATAQWANAAKASPSAPGFFSGPLSQWLIFASLLSYCKVAHYNAPRYYNELDNSTQDRFGFLKMVSRAYISASLIYCFTIFATFRLLGGSGQSFSLNTLSPQDPLGVIAFLAFGTSVLASYPLLFFNVRNWLCGQLQDIVPSLWRPSVPPTLANGGHQDQSTSMPNDTRSLEVQRIQRLFTTKSVATLLLTIIGAIAIRWTDIAKIGSVAGAFFGSSMMFIFPPIMYIGALKKDGQAIDGLSREQIQRKVRINQMLLALGIGLGCMGTINAVLNIMRK
jgi:hypothetical protein